MDVLKLSNGRVLTCKPPDMLSIYQLSMVFWYKQSDTANTVNIIELEKTFQISFNQGAGSL